MQYKPIKTKPMNDHKKEGQEYLSLGGVASEMYEALRLAYLEAESGYGITPSTMQKMKDALAKAEGNQ